MSLFALPAVVLFVVPLMQEAIVAPPPRLPLPRPVAGAPLAQVNDNIVPAGSGSGASRSLDLDIVEAAWRPDGPTDPVVRVLAFAERGKGAQLPGPLIRVPVGTTLRVSVRNRSDSSLTLRGFRRSLGQEHDTLQLAAGSTREVTVRFDAVGTGYYWGGLPGIRSWRDREWLDSQLNGAIVVDSAGLPPTHARERIWVITEWFHGYADRPFESALVFNGRAWPHNDRLTLAQGDSVHWRVINLAAVEHPLHLHGFYFRVTRTGNERADTAVAADRQPLENMHVMQQGATMSLSWIPTTPGNWVFHCHFAAHVGDEVTLHGSPDAHVVPDPAAGTAPAGHDVAGHSMRGLVVGMHVTPAPGYKEPTATNRRTITLVAQKEPLRLMGGRTAYGFMLQRGDSAPPPNVVQLPAPLLELRRGQPVRLVVRNNMDEPTGVHWHGLEIESYPDGVPNFSGSGTKIMPPIAPGDSFVAEFTPPRSGTFPYHSHLHEVRQIGSGMYGALLVTDAPRDTLHDHVVVAGGGGLPVFAKEIPPFLLVNGRSNPRPIRMTVGESNRLRIVSIHSDAILGFRLGTDSTVAAWVPIAKDGADLPPALRASRAARLTMGPGETSDFQFTPTTVGAMQLEVWLWPNGTRVVLPVIVAAKAGG